MRRKWFFAGIFFTVMLANTVYANNTTTVSYTVNPAYTVLIPVDTEVEFNQLSESFGKIQVEKAQLDEGKCIEVSLSSDGVLKNKNNRSDVIPYQILKTSEATPFVSARYHTAGEATPLTISIKQDDWNKAPSGDYSDTVIFTISYVDDK